MLAPPQTSRPPLSRLHARVANSLSAISLLALEKHGKHACRYFRIIYSFLDLSVRQSAYLAYFANVTCINMRDKLLGKTPQ